MMIQRLNINTFYMLREMWLQDGRGQFDVFLAPEFMIHSTEAASSVGAEYMPLCPIAPPAPMHISTLFTL